MRLSLGILKDHADLLNTEELVNISAFLQSNVMPVTGCSEPAAIAYASSIAIHAVSGRLPPDFSGSTPLIAQSEIRQIEVITDRNVFKNTTNAVIPGMDGRTGPAMAAAAGLFLDPRDGLDVLSGMTPEKRARALVIALSDRVVCRLAGGEKSQITPDIRVEIAAETQDGLRKGSVRISGKHNHVSRITVDEKDVYIRQEIPGESLEEKVPDPLIWLIRIAESMDDQDIDLVYRGVEMNLALSRIGQEMAYGLGLGSKLKTILSNQKGSMSLIDAVRVAAAAAADARMGGAPFPVMSSAGSGNQGITALVPVGVVGKECRFSKEEIARAALISHMVTKQADRYAGHLSALCGCSIKAGVGATAGVTYLIGGGKEEITTAINLLVANITGTICDGAKPGCTLKIATAAGLATECAFLAVGGMKIPPENGIIQRTTTGTLHTLEIISQAMAPVDAAVLKILENKPAHPV